MLIRWRKMVINILTFAAAFYLYPVIVNANDAPLYFKGGGATPLFGPTQTIKMKSEKVNIIIGKENYTVDALFNFINTGSGKTELVGFPRRGEGYLSMFKEAAPFIQFETWVNGVKTEFTEEPGDSIIRGGQSNLPDLIKAIKSGEDGSFIGEDSRWMVKRVDFPANSETTTRVRYEAKLERYGETCRSAIYIFGTGRYWKGNIDKAVFDIDTSELKGEDLDIILPDMYKKKYKYTKTKISTSISRLIIKNFEPNNEDQIVIYVGFCP